MHVVVLFESLFGNTREVAEAIAGLRHHEYDLVAEPEGFIMEGTEGPLRAGEPERARIWGPTWFSRPSADRSARAAAIRDPRTVVRRA